MGIEEHFVGTVFSTPEMDRRDGIRSALVYEILPLLNGHRADDAKDALARAYRAVEKNAEVKTSDLFSEEKEQSGGSAASRISQGFNQRT